MGAATLRLLADDLTGALDAAAELVGLSGPAQVFWHGAIPSDLPGNAALDSGTRELGAADAVLRIAALAPALAGAGIAYKKIDSLMRGPTLAEAAACMRSGHWDRAILAPAFPYQGRVTRGGVQHARDAGGCWSSVGGDIVARLCAEGISAQAGRLDAMLPSRGITVFDAETDDDLRRIAAFGMAVHRPLLWMGTGGLAQAIAHASPAHAGPALPRPFLGLFGSDQAVTAGQLAACTTDRLILQDGGPGEAGRLAARLRTEGQVVASLDLARTVSREDAARRIGAELHRLVQGLPPPGTLLVAGGETLRGLCLSLGAHSLEVQGRIVPGLPRSILRGGPWDGVTVVSKSGAFGAPGLLRDLLDGRLTCAVTPKTKRTV